jgi:hypothetical protein
MRLRILVYALGLVGVACIVCVTLFAISGHRRASTPLGVRYSWLELVPIVNKLVLMEAKQRARGDHSQGASLLFGYNQSGTRVPGMIGCSVIEYERDVFVPTDIPDWANRGVRGTMVVACPGSEHQSSMRKFSVVEMGCLGHGEFWTKAYNHEMLASWRSDGESSPTRSASSPASGTSN